MKASLNISGPAYETPIFSIAKCLNEMQNVGQIIFTLDKYGHWNFISNAWQQMLGYDHHLVLGTSILKYFTNTQSHQNFTALISGEKNTIDEQVQFAHKDGGSIWVHVLATSSKDVSGDVTGIFGTIENINDKHITDLRLQESNAKLNMILNSSKEIILTIDLDRNVIENVNEAISLLGYTPDEWIGQNYKSWSADQRQQFHLLMKLAVKSELHVANYQVTFANKNNTEYIPFEFSTSTFVFKNTRYLLCVLRDIRERQQYEDNMTRISNQLTHLINNIDDVYAIYDIKTQQFDFVSENVENLYACDKEDFIKQGLFWKRLIHPDDIESIEKEIEQIIENKSKGEYFYRVTTPVGEVKMLLEKVTVGKDLKGAADKLYIVKTDYTHIEKAEQSLIATEKKFRFISENISDFISIHDTDWNFIYASPSIRNILGFEPEDICGLGGFELVHPADLIKTLDTLEPIVLQKQEMHSRYRMRSKSGKYQWVETYSKPVIDSKGETSSIICSTRNVTDQVNAETMLKESEEKYRFLLEYSNDIISIHNVTGEFTYVSPSIEQVLGYEPADLIGKKPGDLLSANEEAKQASADQFAYLVKEKKDHKYINKVVTSWGEEKLLEIWLQPILKDNQLVSIQASSRDVTQREKLLVELEQSLEKERELNDLRSMFVSTASHQFRTPLTVIQSGVEIMELYLEDLPAAKQKPFQKQFNKIQEEVERLHYLMSDILLLGRANAARTPFNPEAGDIVEFCKDIIENKYNNRYPADRNIILSVTGNAVPVEFDHTLIGHSIENILSNAYKYSSDQNLELNISFESEKVSIAISDHGIGIPEEDLKNLFQPFYRASNTDEIEGTGLGLSIMKEFVDKHSGEIFVTSVLNKGTTLSVVLPIKQNRNQ